MTKGLKQILIFILLFSGILYFFTGLKSTEFTPYMVHIPEKLTFQSEFQYKLLDFTPPEGTDLYTDIHYFSKKRVYKGFLCVGKKYYKRDGDKFHFKETIDYKPDIGYVFIIFYAGKTARWEERTIAFKTGYIPVTEERNREYSIIKVPAGVISKRTFGKIKKYKIPGEKSKIKTYVRYFIIFLYFILFMVLLLLYKKHVAKHGNPLVVKLWILINLSLMADTAFNLLNNITALLRGLAKQGGVYHLRRVPQQIVASLFISLFLFGVHYLYKQFKNKVFTMRVIFLSFTFVFLIFIKTLDSLSQHHVDIIMHYRLFKIDLISILEIILISLIIFLYSANSKEQRETNGRIDKLK